MEEGTAEGPGRRRGATSARWRSRPGRQRGSGPDTVHRDSEHQPLPAGKGSLKSLSFVKIRMGSKGCRRVELFEEVTLT